MKKLEIGDIIYKRISYDGDGFSRKIRYRSRVVKITPTLAITHCGDKFEINSIDGACRILSKNTNTFLNVYTRVEYLIETEELKSAYQKQSLVRKFKEFDFNELSLETLIEINNKLIIK